MSACEILLATWLDHLRSSLDGPRTNTYRHPLASAESKSRLEELLSTYHAKYLHVRCFPPALDCDPVGTLCLWLPENPGPYSNSCQQTMFMPIQSLHNQSLPVPLASAEAKTPAGHHTLPPSQNLKLPCAEACLVHSVM